MRASIPTSLDQNGLWMVHCSCAENIIIGPAIAIWEMSAGFALSVRRMVSRRSAGRAQLRVGASEEPAGRIGLPGQAKQQICRLAPNPKICCFLSEAKHFPNGAVSSHRGALAIVTDAGRDAMDAIVSTADERGRTRMAKSCGPDASTLASSFVQKQSDGDNQSPITGEITKETVKTIACG